MVTVLTIAIILIVGYAQLREGLFTSCVNLVNVVIAGVLAFGFFEPIADWLDPMLSGGPLIHLEDFLALILLFFLAFVILRSITNRLAPEMLAFDGNIQYIGGVVGLLSGYFLAGFLLCAMQTLPLHVNFFDFQPRQGNDPGPRTVFPPDHVWLAMMRHAGAYPLAWEEDNPGGESNYDRFATFDRHGTFELRYLRYRRHTDSEGPKDYRLELDRELGRTP